MTMISRYAVRRPAHLVLAFITAIILVSGRGSGRPEVLAALGNPIPAENAKPGDTDWNISGIGDPAIQGFATDMSVNHNTTVQFKVDVNPAGNFHLDIYRIGYYNGAGARRVATIENQAGVTQLPCTSDTATGLVDCGNWTVSAQWAVPADAVSGVYVAKIVREATHTLQANGGDLTQGSHIVFIVRDDERKADVLFQTSDTTWQAYNRYGGASTYCAPGVGVSNADSVYYSGPCPTRATKVSYNRPFDTRVTSPSSWLFSAEYPMIRFLEANGYDTKYWSGVDTDRFGADPSVGLTVTTKKPKVFLSVGHDEYWSGAQRANVETARNAGVSLAFMSGNEIYWKHRWESSHRTLVTYKETMAGAKIDPAVDPVTGPIWTGTWRDTRFGPHDGGRPENALIGSIWTVNCCTQSGIIVPASKAGLRIWRNTRVANLTSGSTTLGNETLGYEWGEALENGFQPAGLVRLSTTTVPNQEKIQGFGTTVAPGTATHSLTLYKTNSGAIVFGASSVQWSWGLDAVHDNGTNNVVDPAMQQATVNLFADMGAQPATLQVGNDPNYPLLVAATASQDTAAPASSITSPLAGANIENGSSVTISGTATDTGGGQVAGVEVSVDGGASWQAAQGTSNWSFVWTPGALGSANIRTRAIDDSANLGFAGNGITVTIVQPICPCTSLWRPSVVPGTASAADTNSWELGVKFRSDIDGFITGIRFYKGLNNTGTHVGRLWTSTGTLLGSATFTSETATGWQQVTFGSPLPITANTTYVASYNANNGGYAYDGGYFTNSGVDSPPLHAPASGAIGGNAVLNENPMSFPNATFGAANYWVDVVFAQSIQDLAAPVITAVKATTVDSSRVTVKWTTDEASTSRIDYGTDAAILTATLANLPPGTLTATRSAFETQHTVALAALTPNTTYYQLVSSTDASGNTATVAAPTFTVPGPTLRDTASTDFAAGTKTATYVSQTADGEVSLAPTVGAEFNGPTLDGGWIEVPWDASGYSNIVNGILLVDGARVATCVTAANGACVAGETSTSTPSAIYAAPRSLEFAANFSGDQYQHAGFAVTFASADEPWAMFSTLSGGLLFARTNMGGGYGFADTAIGVAPLGEFHRYRIDWKASSVDYYIDGALAVSHAFTVAGPMRPVAASDFNPGGGVVFVDWMRLTPVATPGTFDSRVFDASSPVDWKSIQWAAQTPATANLAISVRTGETPTPDTTWSEFVPVAGSGPLSLRSRYIQYRAGMSSSDPATTPILEDIIISTGSAPIAVPDSAAVAKSGSHTFQASGPGSLTFNDTDADVNDTLRVVGVSAPSQGTVVLNADGSVTYTPASVYEGPDAFIYTVSDGLLTASATVSLDVRFGNIPPVAVNNFYAAVEDTTLTVPAAAGLLANDSDAENNLLQAQLMTLPAHGLLALSANGGFSYTPVANYAGPDAFSYRAFDGTDSGNTAIVQLEIAQVNDAPFTEPDAFTALLDQPLDVPAPGVLANDHDVEVEDTVPMHTQLVTNVSRGQLTLRADGSFSYVPDSSFLGTDSFTYKAVDHFNAVSALEKTVTLTVAIKAAAGTVGAGATVSTGSGVSADDPLSSSVQTPTPATVRIAQGVISGSQSPTGYTFLNQQVNITVTDAAGAEVNASPTNPLVFNFQIDKSLVPAGQDQNTFEIFRNNVLVPDCLGATTIPAANFDPCVSGRSNNGDRISLTILTSHASKWNMGLESLSLGGALVATSDGPFVTNFQVPFQKTAPGVLGNDFGPGTISAQLFGTPEGGTVILAPSGAYTFTPNVGHCGPASFKYKALDGVSVSNEATVSLVVNCVPDAVNDAVLVVEDNATTITVLSNDTDPDVQPLTITAVTQAANGTVAIAAGSMAVSYTPAADFFGSDSFTYTIQDPRGDTDTATVNLTVTPVNDAPSFVLNSDQTVAEDAGPQTVSGLATAMSAGPVNETSQALNFLITNTNNALFSAQPAVDAGGVLTYTPAANAYGAATVTLRIHDDGGVGDGGVDTSAARTFVITVTPVNDDPAANADSATVAEDSGSNAIDVRANDTLGPDANETLTVNAVTQGANGVVAVTATGVSYAPNANYFGADSFTYTISDGNGGSATATVTVTVTPVNDNPVANADSATVAEDSAVTNIAVRANDNIGPDTGETLTVTAVTAAANGTAAVTPTGVSYAPAADYFGADSFTYTISDGNGGTATATVNVTVTPVNDDPIANTDNATVAEDSGVNAIDVRANDTLGPDAGETLAINAVTQGAFGAVAITPTGVTYAPNANYNGPDSFSYTISDGNGGSATATVTVTVTPVNDNPIANADSATVAEDSAVTNIAVRTNDNIGPDTGETLTVTAVTAAANGTAAVTPTGVSYAPAANYFGADSFTYTISDGNGGSAIATVNVTVTPVNDNPVATADSKTVAEDSGTTAITVLANDTIGPDVGETLTVSAVTTAANGTATFTATGVSYAPNANYFGADSFTYTISDGNGGSATATVNVTVTPVNDNPVANADSATVAEDSGVTNIAVRTNDNIGPDVGETLSVTAVTQGANGAVTFTATGVSYAPNANFNGSDSFTYTIGDGNGGSATATVGITVTPVNDNPVATADSKTVAEDSGTTAITVLANDTMGPDVGETLSVTAVTQGAHGAATFTATGVSYAPAANYNGPDSFTYTIGDGNGGSATATVTVTVTAVNDNPTVVADAASVMQNGTLSAIAVLTNDNSSPDGPETLTITSVTQGAHGIVAITGSGTTVSYAAAAGYSGPDTFTYTIGDGNGGSATGTVTITVIPTPSLRIENMSVVEGNSGFTAAVFPVNLSNASMSTVTVGFQTFTGSARDVRDYVSTNGTVTFAPGQTSKTVTVQVIGETTREKDETFSVRLSAPVNATIARAEAIGIIIDDDTTPVASVSSATTSTRIKEGDGPSTTSLTFKVTLSNTSEVPLSVDYSTLGLGATPGVDYENTSGTLSFGEDETVKYITIPITGDRKHEVLERVRLHLGNAIEMILTTSDLDGEIEDDDPVPSVSVQDVSVVEGNNGTANAVFTVTLSEASGMPGTVTYQTANGTATAGSDYTAVSGSLTFAEGVTSMTVSVPISGDAVIEQSETFTLNLAVATDVTVVRGQATARIVNDDASTWASGTFADLSGGTAGTGAYVARMSDGAVILQPRLTSEFTGPTLPAGWFKGPGGALTFVGGSMIVDGFQITNTNGLLGNQTLEFAATYNGVSQFMGSAQLRFNTKADGRLYATTLMLKGGTIETVVPGNMLGAPHRFRIDLYGSTITYSIDGVVVATHTATFPSNTGMILLAGDLGTGVLSVDWMRMSPYQPSGEFTSAIFDAGQVVTWNTASWVSELPAGTALSFQVRTGSTPAPDASWTGFVAVPASGGAIGGTNRFAQYRAVLTTTAPGSTPALKDVVITYTK